MICIFSLFRLLFLEVTSPSLRMTVQGKITQMANSQWGEIFSVITSLRLHFHK